MKFSHFLSIGRVLAGSAIIALSASVMLPSAQAADAVIATVNGKPIKQSTYDFIVKDAAARGQTIDENTRSVIINKLVSSELVAQEAQRIGLEKQPDFLARQELAQRELLVNAFLADYIKKNPVSDADTRAAYDDYKKQLGDKEYSASHILVETEAEAKDIIAQLGKGGDFAKIAKDKSKDPGSQDKGGDLGWFSLGGMVKPFGDAVAKLQKGGITQTPVQTQFGWHVIKLNDIRDAQPPAYEKVKDDLQKRLQQQKLEKLLSDLRAKAKITDTAAAKK